MKKCYLPSYVTSRGNLVEEIVSTAKTHLTMHSHLGWETVVH